MKRRLLLLPVLFCAGCASPYWQNRRADAADVFTAAVGVGLGATARIGPLRAGLGAHYDLYGVEAGETGQLGTLAGLVVAGPSAGEVSFLLWGESGTDLYGSAARRGKNHCSIIASPTGGLGPVPLWDPPGPAGGNPARWTQIEVAAGLLGGVRLGFNPGELLDFVLGFFGVDLYDDDVAGLPPDERTPAQVRFDEALARMEEEAKAAERRRQDRRLARFGFTKTAAFLERDYPAPLVSWRPDFAAAGWVEKPCNIYGRDFDWYRVEKNTGETVVRCIVGVAARETPAAAHETMAGRLRWHGWEEMETRHGTPGAIGDVLAVRVSHGWPDLNTRVFRRNNLLVEVSWTGTNEHERWTGWPEIGKARPLEGLARALDTQILAAVQPHAEGAEMESHAESAEGAEAESHAESAEGAELNPHAESAEDAESESHAESAEDAESEPHAENAEDAE